MDIKENQAQEIQPQAPDVPGEHLKKKKKKKNVKKIIKRIIGIIILLAILGGIAFGMYKLFHKEKTVQEAMTDYVTTGSIQSVVSGSGTTTPKDSSSITLTASGTVLDVYVSEGQWVNEGDPLYVIDSTEAQEAVKSAQDNVDGYQKQINDINASYADLTLYAPYYGKLLDIATLQNGDTVSTGTQIATIVDDSIMKLKLYFSYAYKDNISQGQSAVITVPSTMSRLDAKVDSISYVNYISPEGGTFFEVTLSVQNPGTLTEGTAASATLLASDGTEIYPYDSGKFEYNSKKSLTAKASGTVESINLTNYMYVNSGDLLLKISAEDNDEQITSLQNSLKEAQKTLTDAQDRLKNYNATAPMSGTVISCPLVVGETATSGTVAVSIADTSVMTVEAQIDELNVSKVHNGMLCTITQGDMTYTGTVQSVSLTGKSENGVSYFPAVITVDNTDGALMNGMYVDYSMVASESDNCLLVPVQAVKYTEAGTVVFIRSDPAPDNALDASTLGIDVPDGFCAIPVTVGLSDDNNAEIIDGVEEGTEVFVQYLTDSGDSFSSGMMVG